MKILKRIGIVLLVLVALYCIVALFCKSDIHVERSVMINTDAATPFNNVNTIKTWKTWSYWDQIDPNMQSTYTGPESGVGAMHQWTSENDTVSYGTLKITKSEPNTFVEFALNFQDMGDNFGGWRFKDTTGGTLVTTYLDMPVPFFLRPVMAAMNMDEMLGTDFQKSLDGLKKVSEAAPSTPPVKIEVTTTTAMKALLVADSCDEKNIGQKLGELYGEIGQVAEKTGAKMAGPVFAIYNKVENDPNGSMKFWLEAGVPIDKEVKGSGRVNYREIPAGTAVKAWHYGSYESTAQTHETMDAWMKTNNKTVTGAPWEVYVTDPMVEKDTAKWLTEIYYPVQ